jgi:hypothetical protein
MLWVSLFLLFINDARSQGFLKTKGTAIVNEKGETVILRGMGLGGWMLQEGYMFKLSNLGQQYKIKEKIQELIGVERTELFYDHWLLNHTTRADIDSMSRWGFNSIRLPMHYNLYTLPSEKETVPGKHTWLEKGFALTDSLLNWCKANKMYLILDLHAAPGGQGNDLPISDRDPAKPSLWQSSANQEKTIALWHKLAERYANEPWIGGYDIINEPNWGFEDSKDVRGMAEKKNEPLRKLMMQITSTIREVDKKHIIIIEGNGFGNNYDGVLPAWDDNMVLSFHKYGNFNTVTAIQKFLNLRDQHKMPLWLGESGENSNTWFSEAIRLVESNGIGWAWWQNKKMGINNPLEIKRPKGYQKLLDYWAGIGAKPGADEAGEILRELIQNLKIANNVYHKDVVDAMFRQIHSTVTVPFKEHIVKENRTIIKAVDFDMGRQQYAYYDKDTARYQYTPGVNTIGNRGSVYRNDGVDIRETAAGASVFSIEDGEWLQYTVQCPSPGRYNIFFETASDSTGGQVSLLLGEQVLVKDLVLPVTNSNDKWKASSVKDIFIPAGTHPLRVYANKGGFILNSIQFDRQ